MYVAWYEIYTYKYITKTNKHNDFFQSFQGHGNFLESRDKRDKQPCALTLVDYIILLKPQQKLAYKTIRLITLYTVLTISSGQNSCSSCLTALQRNLDIFFCRKYSCNQINLRFRLRCEKLLFSAMFNKAYIFLILALISWRTCSRH